MKQDQHVSQSRHPIQDHLKAYADGELSWLRRIMARRHLASCAGCREEVQAMQMLHKGLRDGEGSETILAPALRERILAQVAGIPPLPAPRRAPRLVQYGLATSLAVNCFFLFLLNRSETVPPVSPALGVINSPGISAPTNAPLSARSHPQRRSAISRQTGETSAAPSASATSFSPAVIVPPPAEKARIAPSSLGDVSEELASKNNMTPPVPVAAPSKHSFIRAKLKTISPITSESDVNMPRAAKRMDMAADQSALAPATGPAPPAPGRNLALPPAPMSAPLSNAKPAASPPLAPAAPLSRSSLGDGSASPGFGGERDKPIAVSAWPDLSPPPAKSVEVDWQVDEQGNASDIRFTATGIATIDTAIREAVRRNHYLPAMKDSRPITARMSHTFVINP